MRTEPTFFVSFTGRLLAATAMAMHLVIMLREDTLLVAMVEVVVVEEEEEDMAKGSK